MKRMSLLALAMAVALALNAGLAYAQVTDPCAHTYPFTAGQTINAGSVTVTNDANYLKVTFTTTGDWYLDKAHLWVGIDIKDIPFAQGNPVPGQFPWQTSFTQASNTTAYTFTIAKSDLEAQLGITLNCPNTPTFYFVAHASIFKYNADGSINSQTGWGGSQKGTSGNKWWFFDQYTWCCGFDPVEACAETAFGKYDTANVCFLDDGFNRWGWTNGPLSAGFSGSFNLYAGAGQCDTAKGTLVGTVNVDYTVPGTVTVTYNITPGSNFNLTQTHLYVGANKYPQVKVGNKWVNTVAPGQYPYIHDSLANVQTDTFTVTGVSGKIYVIAHGVVEGPCGDFTTTPE
jgi:hypothetical protein